MKSEIDLDSRSDWETVNNSKNKQQFITVATLNG